MAPPLEATVGNPGATGEGCALVTASAILLIFGAIVGVLWLGAHDGIAGRLSAGPLMGGDWSVADCAVNAYLAYLPIFFPQIDLSPYPHVQATIAATQQRPAYQRVMAGR